MRIDVSRQVLPIAERILVEQGKLGAIALKNRKGEATSTKVEWKEMSMGAIKVKLTTETTSGYFETTAGKEIEVDTTNLLVGDILSVQDENGKNKTDIRIMITEITNSTHAKAQKIGGTDVVIKTSDVLFVESTANEEGSKVGKRRPALSPRTRFNYTQIIRAGHIIPRTQAQIENYDFTDIKRELRTQAYKRYAENFDGMITSTVRAIVSTSNGDKRIAGGLGYFAHNDFNPATGEYTGTSTDNVKVVNSALTVDDINLMFKKVIEAGGEVNSVVVNTAQAIAISKLYQDKVNVNVINGTAPTTIGGAVQILKSPIVVGGNQINNIYLDLKMPQDEAIFFNDKMIEAKPLKGSAALETITEENAKDDNYSIDLLGEWTVIFRNAKENTFTLKKLDV